MKQPRPVYLERGAQGEASMERSRLCGEYLGGLAVKQPRHLLNVRGAQG